MFSGPHIGFMVTIIDVLHHDDKPQLAMVNGVVLPQAILITFLYFPQFLIFQDAWRNQMQMKGNEQWGFALTLLHCSIFQKVFKGAYWGKLWNLIVSYEFSIYNLQNMNVLPIHQKKSCYMQSFYLQLHVTINHLEFILVIFVAMLQLSSNYLFSTFHMDNL